MPLKTYIFGLSTTIDYSVKIVDQTDLIAKAGFNFISLGARLEHCSFFQPDKFKIIRDIAIEKQLAIESVHALFGKEYDIASESLQIRNNAIASLEIVAQLARDYKIPIVILHPHDHFYDGREKCLERAVNSLEKILAIKPPGIGIALENMPGKDSYWIITNLLNIFDREKYGFCYDSSHENMTNTNFPLLKMFYNRLTACHLSDNHGQSDEHLMPGAGTVDWKKLRMLFDKSHNFSKVLFEVGTGAPLPEYPANVIDRIYCQAKKIFDDNDGD
jgi:L-ribulose-5-phosphate 3-epimerase